MNIKAFVDTLPIMGKGMLGIFVVTIIIIAAMVILNSATGNKH
jgi:hypothetical protein